MADQLDQLTDMALQQAFSQAAEAVVNGENFAFPYRANGRHFTVIVVHDDVADRMEETFNNLSIPDPFQQAYDVATEGIANDGLYVYNPHQQGQAQMYNPGTNNVVSMVPNSTGHITRY